MATTKSPKKKTAPARQPTKPSATGVTAKAVAEMGAEDESPNEARKPEQPVVRPRKTRH